MSAQPTNYESFGTRARRALRKRLSARTTIAEEAAHSPAHADNMLIHATRGETINHEHLARVLAERQRRQMEVAEDE
jgi:hypothetical protein